MDMSLTDSDWDNSSDSSNSDHEEALFSYNGQAQNIFSNLEETIGKIDDFLSFERAFTHGDIVRSTTEPSGQSGRVINITTSVNLESINGKIVKEVDTKTLKKLRSVSLYDYVVNGTWLGRVDKIIERVYVTLDDGSNVVTDQDNILVIPPNHLEDSQYSYYPGQRVEMKSTTTLHPLRSTTWLCGNWRENRSVGTVISIEAGILYVDWIASVVTGATAPQALQYPESLTLLPSFTSWQLGDWCMLTEPQTDFNRNSSSGEVFVITKTKMKIDIMWQDGSFSLGVDSQRLVPVGAVNAHDFWPEQFVVEKDTCKSERWGVVKSVNGKEQTVKVLWSGEGTEEVVSAYELLEHPDFGFCFSDVVYRNVESGGDCLSSIGVVTGFKNGGVEVKWANGSTSKVAPYEILRMERSELSNSSSNISSEGSVQDLSQKIVLSDESSSNHQEADLVKLYSSENILEYSFLPKAAIGFITNLASRLFGSPSSSVDIHSHSRCNDSEVEGDFEVPVHAAKESYDISGSGSCEVVTATMANDTIDLTLLENSKKQSRFKHFDMTNDCSDHHFLSAEQPQFTKSWVKKVQQEWTNLEANLPNTIYVRVYEERMDLLRAALVGAPGTPYHDGLFFFDIMLPPQYPHDPPLVHYHSGGMRLNPNLYESGKVCLSLLNTWNGSGTEIWNAESSSILQVLLSFQALVLNEKPYFNEAGYDKQLGRVEGEKNSVSYNENAFLVTCKSMILLLRRPPKHFEVLVKDHFINRGKHVLAACKSYMEGVPVGSSSMNMEDKSTTNSTGFKIMLSKLYPKLVEAFSEIAAEP